MRLNRESVLSLLPPLGVFAAACALFAVGVTNDHLSMDDWGYIYGCPFVRDGLTWRNVWQAFTVLGYDAFWMPLTYVSYMCDITLLGGGWPVHHAVNVALHGANAVLAWMLARRCLAGRGGRLADVACALGVLVWALHPMRAEAVTYVASRKELLWSLFALGGLLVWWRFLDAGRRRDYGLAWICCVLACLSKPTAVCFPLLAYIVEAIRARRLWNGRLLRYVPFLVVSCLVGLLTLHVQAHPIDHEQLDVFGETFGWRLLNAAVGLGMHIWHTIRMSDIHFDYRAVFGGRPLNLTDGLGMLMTAVVGLYACARALRRRRGAVLLILLAAAWAVVALLPVSGVLGTVNGDHAYADRYTYLPFVGVALPLCLLLTLALRQHLVPTLLVVVGVLAVECVQSVAVIRSFRNDYTAFSRTLAHDPEHWRALRIVGNEYCARLGRTDEGVEMLRRSLRLRSSQHTAESLAYILAVRGQEGDFREVRELCRGVMQDTRRDRLGMMLDALGIVALREGDDTQAVRYLAASLRAPGRNYSNSHTMLNLALALANSGRKQEAANYLMKLARSPDAGIRRRGQQTLEALRRGNDGKRFEWCATPF